MTSESKQRAWLIASDYVTTNIALLVYNVLRYYMLPEMPGRGFSTLQSFLTYRTIALEQLLFPIFMLGVYFMAGCYNRGLMRSRLQELMSTVTTAIVAVLALFFGAMINDLVAQRIVTYELLLLMWCCFFGFVYLPRYVITTITSRRVLEGRWGYNTLVVGTSQQAFKFARKLQSTRNKMGLRLKGFVRIESGGTDDVIETDCGPLPVYDLSVISDVIATHDIRSLVVVPHRGGMHATTELINNLLPLDVHIYITPDIFELMTSRPRMLNVASEPLVEITRNRMSAATANFKRAGDIILSACTLVAIAPMMAVLAVLIKRDSPGPVFYRQERIGRHKKPFYIYKLRSMTVDAESGGPALSTVEDPRITPLGRILRKYRLDEFPQFWNVLKGDMSIVGPRPEREYYIRQIVERVPHYTLIHSLRPGITSWGMVKYGYASNVDQMLERLTYDLLYIDNVSFTIDMKIIIYTVRTVLTGKGI